MERIYLSPPDVGERERELLLDAFDSGWIAPLGPHVDEFEREFAARLGLSDAVALASGTAGLHLALLVLGIGPGDDVVLPSLTFAATANAVRYVGARPCFVDSTPVSWNIDPDLVAEELDERARSGRPARAVIAVDLYGQCANYDRLEALCAEHGIPLIADAAESLGATYRDKPAGSFGTVAVFSFNGNKIMTTSGGGMLVSNDSRLTARARHLATQAREPALHYEHRDVGYNYRLSNLLAALGRAQLESLDHKIARRRTIHERYREAFSDLDDVAFMPIDPNGTPNWWLTVLTIDEATGIRPDDLCRSLDAADIEARPAWKPMHLQPAFRDFPMRDGRIAEAVFRTGVCLPSGSNLTDSDQDRVIDVVRAALQAR
ncbi:MAG: aminotransferase class I/II-fold pyridoxal phosphate-dependent enzyme [Acidimicrobiales bacterium]|nr:aminotransferase class I/II-fold pyridoxal phosphate-dependent enzyme [Acidimicrobiales bacterium]